MPPANPLPTPFLQSEGCKEFPGLVAYASTDFGNQHLGKPAWKVYMIERTGRSIDQGLHTVPQLGPADAGCSADPFRQQPWTAWRPPGAADCHRFQ